MDRPHEETSGPFALTTEATDGLRVVRDPEESRDTEMIGTGSLLRGRYRLTTVIGRGGMADVYRAMDQVLAREVAVKVFRPGTDRNADRKRFLGEVHTLAGLTHPHLVALYDGGQHEAQPWCVMQLVDGGTLADLDGAQSPAMIAGIGAQIADGLDYIHDRGIVHRDVKPSNVLLDGFGGAFLSDFGVAQIVDATRMTATGALLGTAAYLSPEQVRGRPATTAVDVYALALVLLEVITGQREFPGAPVESAVARLSRPPHIPGRLGPAWAQLLAAMSDIEPERRPDAATAAGVLRALAREEHTETVTVPVQRVPRPPLTPASRTPNRGTAFTPVPAEYEPSTTVIRTALHAATGRAAPGIRARIVRSLTVNPAGTAAVSLAMVLAVVGLTQLPGLDPGGSVSPQTTVDPTGNQPGSSGGGLGDGLAGQTGDVEGPSADWWAEPVTPATTSRNTRTVVAGTGTTVDGTSAPPASTTKPPSPSPSASPTSSPSKSPTPTPSSTPTPTPSATESVPVSPSPTPTLTPTTPVPTPSSSSGTGGGGLGGPSSSAGTTPTSGSPTTTPGD